MVQRVQDQPCRNVDCGCLPAEFVRLRYFFGQRLGVVDFNDAQAYAVGKQRFHNGRLHGSGILCGLRAERYYRAQGASPQEPTTVLAVTRGAAIDACGREIIVPADQCIDVAAWFAVNRERDEVVAWANPSDGEELAPLWVCLKYRDCPSDPMLAPRDPCGCDTAGCEYARVRESFELSILTPAELPDCAGEVFPSREDLRDLMGRIEEKAVTAGGSHGALTRGVKRLLAHDCPLPRENVCICLASFAVELSTEDPTTVVDISGPDNATPQRASLLSTAAMQTLLIDLLAGSGPPELPFGGPTLGGLAISGPREIRIAVRLAGDPLPGDPVPLVESTVEALLNAKSVSLALFDHDGGWSSIEQSSDFPIYSAADHQIVVKAQKKLKAEAQYRLTLTQPYSTPAVDKLMRPLRPSPMAWHFSLEEDASGKLILADPVLAGEGS